VLAHTGAAPALGIDFPSPLFAAHAQEIAARDKRIALLGAEIARIKDSVSWKLTAPLRVLANAASRLSRGGLKR
jgi:hypothetical protein